VSASGAGASYSQSCKSSVVQFFGWPGRGRLGIAARRGHVGLMPVDPDVILDMLLTVAQTILSLLVNVF
jgi:hypothetical protein